MFTGIIQALGSVATLERKAGDIRLGINTGTLDLTQAIIGDSIAVNGVCLTAVALSAQGFAADLSIETLDKTSLGQLQTGSPVNLEKALTLSTALGGHLVSGHVDGLAMLVAVQKDARSTRYSFELPSALQHYVAVKGSITIDGTSLTVNAVEQNRFEVNIVPHTLEHTIFGYYQLNTQVNIEVDIIARYLERLINGKAEAQGVDDNQLLAALAKSGFIQ